MVNKKMIANFLGMLFLTLSFFFETALLVFNAHLVTIFQILSIICLSCAATKNGKLYFPKKITPFMTLWVAMVPFFAYGLLHSEKIVVLRILFGIIICLLLTTQQGWMKYLKNFLLLCGGSAIFFTLFFRFFPNLYSMVVDFYGYYPLGTGQLKYGYRAGITAHYSQNGIYIAVFIMTVVALMLAEAVDIRKKNTIKKELLVVGLSFFAFLLNGKRGTLVWCIITVIITWYVSTEKKTKFFTRAVVLFCMAFGVLQVALEYIPELEFIVERFSKIGSDNSSSERLAMWALALVNFVKSPFFGIGFLNFRGLYSKNLANIFIQDLSNISSYRRLDAHNVYIQVLCEMGILGFFVYIASLVLLMRDTVAVMKVLVKKGDEEGMFAAFLSFGFQIFYLLYSLSGNCLYDMTFYLYIFSMALTNSLNYKVKNMREGDNIG